MQKAPPDVIGGYLRWMRERWSEQTGHRVPVLRAQLGIARPTLYLWESSRTRIDPSDVRRLLTFYGCTEEEIAKGLDLRSRLPPPPPQVGRRRKRVSIDDRQHDPVVAEEISESSDEGEPPNGLVEDDIETQLAASGAR